MPLLDQFRQRNPRVKLIVDTDLDYDDGDYDEAVQEGLRLDQELSGHGWDGLEVQALNEDATLALSYTSGTTARPKGVEYTHRGAYLGALGNVVESGLNFHEGRCKYLWTLPMFHAMGEPSCGRRLSNSRANRCRVDIPVGRYSCEGYTLLSKEDRLSAHLASVERGGVYSF